MALVVESIAVGTELLLGQIANTNAQLLARMLAEQGLHHYFQSTVGDNRERLTQTLHLALGRSDVVVTIGGLGPTQDDLTKEVVAGVFHRGLVVHEPSWERIRGRIGAASTPNNRRQAEIPADAEVIANEVGLAPGVLLAAPYRAPGSEEALARVVICLPGPPNEFGPMVRGPVAQYLAALAHGSGRQAAIQSRSLHLAGVGESKAEHLLQDVIADLDRSGGVTLATYAKPGDVEVRLTAHAPTAEEAQALLRPVEEAVRARVGPWVYGTDGATLGGATLRVLSETGRTLAVAESCTGGELSAWLTADPGASAGFLLGAVTYGDAAKRAVAAVDAGLLAEDGAVSAAAARAMAEGVRRQVGATVGLAVTGFAGPEGGTAADPVGTVYVGLAAPEGTWDRRLTLRGDRAAVRRRAVQESLQWLRRYAVDGAAAMRPGNDG